MNERVRRSGARQRLTAEARREQVIDVAVTMIAERGFWATSLREVADACGITVAGVLHHFPSKEALLVAVLERRDWLDARTLSERLGLDVQAGRPPEVPLGRLCAEVVGINEQHPQLVHLFTVLAAEALDPDHPAHEYFARRQAEVLRWLAEAAPPDTDAEAVARHVMALMDGLQLQWLRDPSRDWVADWRRVSARIPELRDA